MSYAERRVIASLVSNLLMFGGYFLAVAQMSRAGLFEGAGAGSLLGQAILVLIAGGIVLHIVVTLALNLGWAIIEGARKPSFIVDERDKLIELKGRRVSEVATGLGVVTAMTALALGQAPFLVFNLIVAAFGAGGLASDLARLRIYRQEA